MVCRGRGHWVSASPRASHGSGAYGPPSCRRASSLAGARLQPEVHWSNIINYGLEITIPSYVSKRTALHLKLHLYISTLLLASSNNIEGIGQLYRVYTTCLFLNIYSNCFTHIKGFTHTYNYIIHRFLLYNLYKKPELKGFTNMYNYIIHRFLLQNLYKKPEPLNNIIMESINQVSALRKHATAV